MVTPDLIGATTTIAPEEREALMAGLQFVQLLRAHFPAWYIQHVAAQKLSYGHLYGAATGFLTLAHNHLLALDLRELPGTVKPKNPLLGLQWRLGEQSSRADLCHRLKLWLTLPLPRVYGLGRDLQRLQHREHFWGTGGRQNEQINTQRHALAVTLWLLVSDGPWAVVARETLGRHADAHPESLRQAMILQEPLAPAVPLARLCARLDRLRPHGVGQLGSILAYVCGRTDNPYADWSPQEIRQRYDLAVDLDWRRPAETFAEERQRQQQAKRLAGAYGRLDGRINREPELLLQLGQAIRATAGEVLRATDDPAVPDRGEAYNPARLISLTEGA